MPAESLVNLDNAAQWLAELYRKTNRPTKAAELPARASF